MFSRMRCKEILILFIIFFLTPGVLAQLTCEDSDINTDNDMNLADLIEISRSFGLSEGDTGYDETRDVNRDGDINVIDLSFVSLNINCSINLSCADSGEHNWFVYGQPDCDQCNHPGDDDGDQGGWASGVADQCDSDCGVVDTTILYGDYQPVESSCFDDKDNDCDGESDHDNQDGRHGDSDCPVSITGISVSDKTPNEDNTITVSCSSSVAGANSILAGISSTCTYMGCSGSSANFTCTDTSGTPFNITISYDFGGPCSLVDWDAMASSVGYMACVPESCTGNTVYFTCTENLTNPINITLWDYVSSCASIDWNTLASALVSPCTWSSWVANDANFNCNTGDTTGLKMVGCYVDRSRSYKAGSEYLSPIRVYSSDCVGHGETYCNNNPNCEWCESCNVNNQYSGVTDRCVDAGNCVYSCEADPVRCGASCDLDTVGCPDTECDDLDSSVAGCYPDGTWRDYSDENNDCLSSGCSCESNSCTSYTVSATDVDGDGYDTECDGDCDDNPGACGSACHPGATELCDGYDNDCDGFTDEDFDEETCYTFCLPPHDYNNIVRTGDLRCCGDDANEGTPYQFPETSCFDGNDNDCDGFIDSADPDCGATCTNTGERDYWVSGQPDCNQCNHPGDDDGDQGGIYWIMADMCDSDCGVVSITVQYADYQGTEVSCDGIDNDCNGIIDDGCSEICGNSNDDDDNGESDYDDLDGLHGDVACPVSITSMGVQDNTPDEYSTLNVYCVPSKFGVNSVEATLGGTPCTFTGWSGYAAALSCDTGAGGTKTAVCGIDTAKSYQSGYDLTRNVLVGGGSTCGNSGENNFYVYGQVDCNQCDNRGDDDGDQNGWTSSVADQCDSNCGTVSITVQQADYQLTETRCDGIDNDCDGTVDEGCGEICETPGDEDSNGQSNHDSLDGLHGDVACPVAITGMSVSDTTPGEYTTVTVYCTPDPYGVNSVEATLGGTPCTFTGWSGYAAAFSCDTGAAGTKTAVCGIDTAKSYQSGSDQMRSMNIQPTGGDSCSSCASCTAALASASPGDTIQLTADITGVNTVCVDFGGTDGVTFDCGGHSITGDGGSGGIGISLNSGSNSNVIRDCPNINNLEKGVDISSSDSNTLSNITSAGNNAEGINIQSSHSNIISNVSCSLNGAAGLSLKDSNVILVDSIIMSNSGPGISFFSVDEGDGTSYVYNNIFDDNTEYMTLSASTPNLVLNTVLACSLGKNILGKPCLGGNYWDNRYDTGVSEICVDEDRDGICDSGHNFAITIVDEYPLSSCVVSMTFPCSNLAESNLFILGEPDCNQCDHYGDDDGNQGGWSHPMADQCDRTCGTVSYTVQPRDYVATETTCDGIDNDCDGTVDEGCFGSCSNSGEDDYYAYGEPDCNQCDHYGDDDGDQGWWDSTMSDQCDSDCGTVSTTVQFADHQLKETRCSDGIDNDCDGTIDSADTDCSGLCADSEENNYWVPNEPDCNQCNHPGDDDGDQGGWSSGVADQCDSDCGVVSATVQPDDYETTETTCDGIDNDCDGTIDEGCGGGEICGNGIDDDSNGQSDYDSLDGLHGDVACPVAIEDMSVSDTTPGEYATIDVYCTPDPYGVNSVEATLGGASCAFIDWSGLDAQFICDTGAAGTKTVVCGIDTTKSYQSGSDQTTSVNVQSTGGTTTCSSCADCTSKIQSASPGDTIQLSNHITNIVDIDCIDFGPSDGITFDCNGYYLMGGFDPTGTGIALTYGSDNNVIRNCPSIFGLGTGIEIRYSEGNLIEDVFSFSNEYGLTISHGTSNTVRNSFFSGNEYNDFYLQATSVSECSNTLENVSGSGYRPIGFYNSAVNLQDQVFSTIVLCNADGSNLNNVDIEASLAHRNNGFYMFFTDSSAISGMNCSSNREIGIYNSNHNTFSDITAADNLQVDLYVSSSDYNDFTGMTLENSNGGMLLEGSGGITLTNSTITSCNEPGVSVFNGASSPTSYIYNNMFDNNIEDVRISSTSDVALNTALDCGSGPNIMGGSCMGGNFWGSSGGTGFSETCTDSNTNGICDSGYTPVSGYTDNYPLAAEPSAVTTCNSCADCTSKIQSASPGDIIQLSANIMDIGDITCIDFGGTDGITLDCNGYSLNGAPYSEGTGISLTYDSDSNAIMNCPDISELDMGIEIGSSDYNIIENVQSHSNDYGLMMYYSMSNIVRDSSFQENRLEDFRLFSDSESQCSNILENVIGSGDSPIGLYNSAVNLQDQVFSTLVLCNADGSNLNNVDINGSSRYQNNGFYMQLTDNAAISGMDSISNRGIFIENSNLNHFSDMNVRGSGFYGIYMYESDYNDFHDSRLTSAHANINAHYSDHNEFTGMVLGGGFRGINIYESGGIILRDSEITGCSSAGVAFWEVDSGYPTSYIYNNIFDENSEDIYLYYSSPDVVWNSPLDCGAGPNIMGGSCMGGNFWGNSGGTGFSETCTDSDSNGICDSSYTPISGQIDNLPLTISVTGDIVDCNSCDDCNSKIQLYPPGSIIRLVADINNREGGCIYIDKKTDLTFDCNGHLIEGNSNGDGIYLDTSEYIEVKNCVLRDFWYNIHSYESFHVLIENIDSENIDIEGSDDFVIRNVVSSGTGGSDISIRNGEDFYLENIVTQNSYYDGLSLWRVDNVTVKNLVSTNNRFYGLSLTNVTGGVFTNMTLSGNTQRGIWIQGASSGNTIKDSYIENNVDAGITFHPGWGDTYPGNNLFYNNYINNYVNVEFFPVSFSQEPPTILTNSFNSARACGGEHNIINGNCIGGNYWATPYSSGFSQTCTDDGQGICTTDYFINSLNLDYEPLTD